MSAMLQTLKCAQDCARQNACNAADIEMRARMLQTLKFVQGCADLLAHKDGHTKMRCKVAQTEMRAKLHTL
eukprot:1158599-Pelagomonas_calceolata.AAC.19